MTVFWPYTMNTLHQSDFITNVTLLPTSTFYRIMRCFHRASATAWHGTRSPPDSWSHPFGTCICSTFCDQSFSRTCRYFSWLCTSNIPRYFLDFALYATYRCIRRNYICKYQDLVNIVTRECSHLNKKDMVRWQWLAAKMLYQKPSNDEVT